MALRSEENARHGLAQHTAILVALQARDAGKAVALAEEHDRSSIRHLRRWMTPAEDERGFREAAEEVGHAHE
jgi:DNA-binding GntR family transcriptional regulator